MNREGVSPRKMTVSISHSTLSAFKSALFQFLQLPARIPTHAADGLGYARIMPHCQLFSNPAQGCRCPPPQPPGQRQFSPARPWATPPIRTRPNSSAAKPRASSARAAVSPCARRAPPLCDSRFFPSTMAPSFSSNCSKKPSPPTYQPRRKARHCSSSSRRPAFRPNSKTRLSM